MTARAVLAVVTLLLGFGVATPAAQAVPHTEDPVTLVNPLVGTGSGGEFVGSVNTLPGAVAPFGMLSFSPETTSRPAGGGYNHDDTAATGLSLTHLSGVGCPIQGDLPILPTTGDIGTAPGKTTSPFGHDDEQATPGAYAATFGGVRTEVAATTRAGIGEFTFPATPSANLLFKAGYSQNGTQTSDIHVTASGVTGSITGGHFCAQQNVSTVYFAATFDRPVTSSGTWNDTQVKPGTQETSGDLSGAWVTFDTTAQQKVRMKVAISYVGVGGAQANLAAEIPAWDRAQVAAATKAKWRKQLSKIEIGGGTRDQRVQFYTALYHTLLHPNVFSDTDGRYPGFDHQIHTVAPGKARYANFSGWDVYRSLIPLQAMIAPEETSQMMQSLVDTAKEGGWLPKWPVSNGYVDVMNGDAADPMIASAYAFGARDFDTKAALSAMVKGATVPQTPETLGQGYYEQRAGLADYLKLGYVPNTRSSSISDVHNGVSSTLEYALADFSIARFADALGQRPTSAEFLKRSQNWTNLLNPGSGFLQPRDAAGAFPAGNPVTTGMERFGQSGFQEGNAAQYLWLVPQNPRGLIDAIGGDQAANTRLDEFFTRNNAGPNQPYYWAGNEINMHVPWLYNYTGSPAKTQSLIRKTLTTVYSNTPGGEPGNDDLGALSSWYVWSAMGLYPSTPGTDTLAVTSPLFSSVKLNLAHHRVTISAPGAGEYIRGLSVDGRPTQNTWLPGSLITGADGCRGDTRLDFSLSSRPDTGWGTGRGSRPPSYPAGPASFPPGVTPVELTSTPATTVVKVGAQTASTWQLDVGAGAHPARPSTVKSVTWQAVPPPGMTVTPASGTVEVGQDGKASIPVSLSASPEVVQGFTSVPIELSSTTALPRLSLPVSIVGAGDTALVCTTLGATNTGHGLDQFETPGDGATTPVTAGGREARQFVQKVPGNLNMYFRVDNRLVFDGTASATFTVDYFDTGTGGWSLQYDAHGGSAYQAAGSVQNQGTDTWRTATFTVPDAGFADRENEQTDFRIATGMPLIVSGVHLTASGPAVLPMDLCGR